MGEAPGRSWSVSCKIGLFLANWGISTIWGCFLLFSSTHYIQMYSSKLVITTIVIFNPIWHFNQANMATLEEVNEANEGLSLQGMIELTVLY